MSSWVFTSLAQASTDTYTSLPFTGAPFSVETDVPVFGVGPLSANWKNTGANTIDYQILGVNDHDVADADAAVVETGTIAADATAQILLPLTYWQFYRFQQKADSAGNQGESTVYLRVVARQVP